LSRYPGTPQIHSVIANRERRPKIKDKAATLARMYSYRILTFPYAVCINHVKMLPNLRTSRRSTFWRSIYIICTVFVFSYVFFDVLDLDGSDSPLKRHPLERTVVVAKVATDTEHAYSVHQPELWSDFATLSLAVSGGLVFNRITRVLTFSPLKSARTRGYRIALPRSSPADSFHSL
jgi:hypothetical protein